jgi:ribosome-binding protein aMBF1 (putative translation factor)
MTLGEWIKREGISPTDLAKRMNKPQPTIARYINGQRIPEQPIMKEIFEITSGAVTPNDFYGCASPQPETAQ